MLPEREINVLVNTVLEAVELATAMRPAEGQARLRDGLRRAHASLRAGSPWAEALVARYEEALRNYSARYSAPSAFSR